jgi:UDP-N-acetylglucosamine 2-epimerase (non-hydrolysing)
MKIAIILGTRPEIIKLSPIVRECQKHNLDFFILHTNQHFSANMDQVFFDELELPQPKYNLNIQESLHGKMTGRMLTGIEEVLLQEKPDWVLVQGDTNTVLAGGLAAAKLQIKVGHVEAGLRSYDRTMPEELNRIVTDHLSDALFSPTQKQADILKNEGIDQKKIFVTGNTIVDAVYQNREIVKKHPEYDHYKDERYTLLTMHRPANVDEKETLQRIVDALTQASIENDLPIYFPIHPRTKKNLERFGIQLNEAQIKLMDPVGYLEMLALEQSAKVILTDSGGLQEEACILEVPCVTLRENTERPETVEVGASVLVGSDEKRIIQAIHHSLDTSACWGNPFGNGYASIDILKFLRK